MDTPESRAQRKDARKALSGALIVAGLIALAILIISLDEVVQGRVETVDIVAELPESGGLVSGAAVWIAGHEVGEVIAVALLPPSAEVGPRILATARIPESFLPLIRRDSRAYLTSAQLMGHRILEFSPGTAAAPGLAAGDTVRAAHSPHRLDEALGTARGILGDIDSLAGQLRLVASLYRERRPAIDALQRSVGLASAELDIATAAFAEGPLSAALSDARLAERFAAVRAALAEIQQGLARYSTGPLAGNTDALRARADSLRAELATLDSAAADVSGFLGRFAADSAIGREAARAGAQMDSLTREVMSNPLMFF